MSTLSTAKVVIYGAVHCSFCVKAKNLLNKNNVPLNWIDVDI
jgi:glutaredoxin